MLIQSFLFKINRSQITQTNIHLIITDSRRWCLPESRWPVLASEGDDLSFLLTITEHHLTKPAIPCSDSDTELRERQPCCTPLMYSHSLHEGYNQKKSGCEKEVSQHASRHNSAHRWQHISLPSFCVLFFETCAPGRVIQLKRWKTTTRESHIEASCALKSCISRTQRDTWSDILNASLKCFLSQAVCSQVCAIKTHQSVLRFWVTNASPKQKNKHKPHSHTKPAPFKVCLLRKIFTYTEFIWK